MTEGLKKWEEHNKRKIMGVSVPETGLHKVRQTGPEVYMFFISSKFRRLN